MKLGIVRLYVGESGKIGYYNIQEIGLAKALAKRGIKTDIFFLVNRNHANQIVIKDINDKVRVIYIPAIKLANHGVILPKFILNYDLDMVHLLSDNQIMVPSFIRFCNKNNIPMYNYVGTIMSDTNNKIKKFIMDRLTKRNIKYFNKSKTVVKTLNVQEQLKDKGINNTRLIPVGLDLDIVPKLKNGKMQFREELNIPLDKKILIFVGRLEDYKNPVKAILLMKALKDIDKNYLLIIIGQGSLKDKIDNLIREYKLEDNIMLIERVENVKIHSYYKASDMFVNFNDREIFGMSILEAMYQGCKVIAIKAPGPNYIIDNNVDGLIMDDFNISNWIKCIEKNINNETISEKATDKIRKCFNWDSIVEQYLALFKSIKGE